MKQYPGGLRSCNTALIVSGKDRTTMGNDVDERWLSRQELADRYGLPVKTIAQWASKGTGPLYARMGRHVRYRLSDVVDWESARIDDLREDTHRAAAIHHQEFEQVAPTASRDVNDDSVGNVR